MTAEELRQRLVRMLEAEREQVSLLSMPFVLKAKHLTAWSLKSAKRWSSRKWRNEMLRLQGRSCASRRNPNQKSSTWSLTRIERTNERIRFHTSQHIPAPRLLPRYWTWIPLR